MLKVSNAKYVRSSCGHVALKPAIPPPSNKPPMNWTSHLAALSLLFLAIFFNFLSFAPTLIGNYDFLFLLYAFLYNSMSLYITNRYFIYENNKNHRRCLKNENGSSFENIRCLIQEIIL